MEKELYLGYNMNYWLELQRRANELDVIDYLQEIADLRGKLSFVRSRISQIISVIE